MKRTMSLLMLTLFALAAMTACGDGGDGGGKLSGTYQYAPAAMSSEYYITAKFSGSKVTFTNNGETIKASFTYSWPEEEGGKGTIEFTPEDSELKDIRFSQVGRICDLSTTLKEYSSDSGRTGIIIGSMVFTKD